MRTTDFPNSIDAKEPNTGMIAHNPLAPLL